MLGKNTSEKSLADIGLILYSRALVSFNALK